MPVIILNLSLHDCEEDTGTLASYLVHNIVHVLMKKSKR